MPVFFHPIGYIFPPPGLAQGRRPNHSFKDEIQLPNNRVCIHTNFPLHPIVPFGDPLHPFLALHANSSLVFVRLFDEILPDAIRLNALHAEPLFFLQLQDCVQLCPAILLLFQLDQDFAVRFHEAIASSGETGPAPATSHRTGNPREKDGPLPQ